MTATVQAASRTTASSHPDNVVDIRERRMRVLFHANARPLRRFLLRLTQGQYEIAEDLLQETMLRAWRKMDELPTEAESLRRWLFTVARHLVIDAFRARLARPVEAFGDDVSWMVYTEGSYDNFLDRQMLRDALLRLTSEQRVVLVALYYQDASVTEAAAGIGIPEGTVRSRSYYGLRTMREMLSEAS